MGDLWPLLTLPDSDESLPALNGAHTGGDPAVVPPAVPGRHLAQHQPPVRQGLASGEPGALPVPGDPGGEGGGGGAGGGAGEEGRPSPGHHLVPGLLGDERQGGVTLGPGSSHQAGDQ